MIFLFGYTQNFGDGLLESFFWQGTHGHLRLTFLGDEEQGWNTLDPKYGRQYFLLFSIHFEYIQFISILVLQLLKNGSYHLAWSTPISIKIDNGRSTSFKFPLFIGSVIEDLLFEGFVC